jgi:hypothetical protein
MTFVSLMVTLFFFFIMSGPLLFFFVLFALQETSDTTSSASNDLIYGHNTHESNAFEPPTCAKVVKDDQPIVSSQGQVQAVPAAIDNSSKKPKAKPNLERAPPISWLRQAAEEIESKNGNGNPNPERTRHSNGRQHRPQFRSTSGTTSSPHAMSETTTGKLQQKDYTSEVDELLPQATALAQVGVTRLTSSPRCTSLIVIAWLP